MRLSESTAKIWMKIDPSYKRRRCSPMTLDSGTIRFMRIFAWVLWRGTVKRQCGSRNRRRLIFRAFRRYVFGTLGNEANFIMQYYFVPCRLSTDPKIHEHEWPWMAILQYTFTIANSLWVIILHTYRWACLYHRISCYQRRSAEADRDPQNIPYHTIPYSFINSNLSKRKDVYKWE